MFEVTLTIDSDVIDVDAEEALRLIQFDAEINGITEEESVAQLQTTLIPAHWMDKFPTDRLTAEGKLGIITAIAEDTLTEEDWELLYDWAYLMTSGPIEDIEGFLDDAREMVVIHTGGLSHREILEALADHWLEAVEDQIPEFIAPYIDREAYGRDIMTSHTEGDYYVFQS